MRILHVISGIDIKKGGPTAALFGLTNAQAAAGEDVSILATYKSEDELASAERFRNKGIDIRTIGPATGALWRHPNLSSAIDEVAASADVIHIHATWEEAQHRAARAAQRLGKPYLIRPCGMLSPWSLAQGWLKKRVYLLARLRRNLNRASAMHYTTDDERLAAAPLNIKAPILIEPNGVDLSEFRDLPPKGFLRSRFPQIRTRKIILFLGRIHKGKGLEMLVPALARMTNHDTVLVVVGPDSGGYKSVVDGMVRRHALGDRAIFTGILTGADRVAALADADLFSLPSEHENFGISIVEALAAGTPIVISDRCGIHAEIAQAHVGAVVPLDVARLASELDRWITDDALRASAAARARPFVWQTYNWSEIATRWSSHYQQLTSADRCPTPC